jgi:hypothetical protein
MKYRLDNIDGSMLRESKLPDVADIYDSSMWEVYQAFACHYNSPPVGDIEAQRRDPRDPNNSDHLEESRINQPIIRMIEILNRVPPTVRQRFLTEEQVFSENDFVNTKAHVIRRELVRIFLILDNT